MAGRSMPVEVVYLGNTSDLEKALVRAGVVAEDTSKKIAGSARAAGAAAAEQAKQQGAASSEIAAAAGRAAVAFTEANAKISAAQKAAGDASARAAKSVGASLDEQKAAYTRAIATQSEFEASSRRAAAASVAAANEQVAAAKRAATAQADAAAKSKAANDSLAKMGGKVLFGGTVGIGAAAYEGVKGMVALQKQMEMLHTQAGASQQQVNGLTKSILNMAGSVGTSPQTLADGMYHVVSSLNATLPAATRSATELNVLRVAAEGAKVGNADLVDVTNALDAAIVSGISGVQNFHQAMGALNSIVGAGDMKMQDLADALSTGLLAPMKTYGLSLKDVGGALAVFGDNNIRGQEAATKLVSAVRIMAAPSAAASKALGAVGLSTLQMANDMRSGGLIKALSDLRTHLQSSGATATQQGLIIARAFGGRQSTGVQVLLNQLDRLKSKTTEVGQGANKFGSAWAATQQTTAQKMDQLKATVTALADRFGGYLIPKLEAVAKATANVVEWFSKHKAAAEALAGVVGGVLAAAITVFTVNKLVALATGLQNIVAGIRTAAGAAVNFGAKILGAGDSSVAATPQVAGVGAAAATTATEVETAGTAATTATPEVEAFGTAAATAGTEVEAFGAESLAAAPGIEAIGAAAVTASAGVDTLATSMTGAAGALSALGPLLGVGGLAAGAGLLGTSIFNKPIAAPSTGTSSAQELKSLLNKGVPSNLAKQLVQKMNNAGALGQSGGSGGGLLAGIGNAVGGVIQGVGGLASGVTLPTTHGGHVTLPSSTLQKYLNAAGAGSSGGTSTPTAVNVGSSGSVAAGSLPANAPTWQKIAAYLSAQGLSKVAISGILGNFAQENGGNTLGGISTSIGPGGIGLAQWIGSRATAERQYASSQNESPGSLNAQLGYLMKELHGSYNPALKAIQGASTPGQAAQEFEQLFEGAGTPVMPHRIANANAAYSQLGSMNLAGGSAVSRTAATATIPAAVATMLATAQAMSRAGIGYSKAGHSAAFDPIATLKKIGIDCSGFVSAVLHSGGLLGSVQTTQGLWNAPGMSPGKGQFVTVYDRHTGAVDQEHTFMEILGKFFESGGKPTPGGGENVRQLTNAQAQAELAGGGFQAYHPAIAGGKMVTLGNVASSGAASAATFQQQLQKAINAALAALGKAGTSLLTKYGNLEQNGSVTGLEKGLGVSTSGMADTIGSGFGGHFHYRTSAPVSQLLTSAFHHIGANATTAQINKAGTGILASGAQGSPQQAAFDNLITQLKATHQKGLEALAAKLVAAHKAALQALSQELYAAQLNKDAESLALQDSQLKAQTTQMANTDAAQLTVAQAQAQAVSNAAVAATQAAADQAKYVSDQAQAQTTYVKDMTQTAQDQFNAMATAIKDQTAINTDRSSGIASAITDQTQITVDTLGERGLFGLNLVAQQLQVQLDVMKAGYDQQIAVAQEQLDTLQLQADIAENAAQIQLDQVTTAQDQLVALAQQNLDAVTIAQDAAVSAAQAHADAVTIAEDQAISRAQAHVDAVTIVQDMKVNTLQQSVDLSSSAPKSVQDALAAKLKEATAVASTAIDRAGATLTSTTDTANRLISGAATNYTNVQNGATAAIGAASNAYTAASDTANNTIASASATLTTVTGNFTVALANASSSLASLEGTASVNEAGAAGNVAIAGAKASTQFAGSGLVVNMYGLNPSDANANANELGWVLRNQLPA